MSRFACGAPVTAPATGALTKLEIVAAEAATNGQPRRGEALAGSAEPDGVPF
jgi:hypothetical protein